MRDDDKKQPEKPMYDTTEARRLLSETFANWPAKEAVAEAKATFVSGLRQKYGKES